jgi:hypothetical protein
MLLCSLVLGGTVLRVGYTVAATTRWQSVAAEHWDAVIDAVEGAGSRDAQSDL